MKISILCSSDEHPINSRLESWIAINKKTHEIELVRSKQELTGGDMLFLISCGEILDKNDLSNYENTLVVHASDLPDGRGWSPHIWQIIEGKTNITVTLFEADTKVDNGNIWKKIVVEIKNHYLYEEIIKVIFDAEIELMSFALLNFDKIITTRQPEKNNSVYYRRRTPEDSKIDPNKTIEAQFDHMRSCDPIRSPIFFELRGVKYKLKLEKF